VAAAVVGAAHDAQDGALIQPQAFPAGLSDKSGFNDSPLSERIPAGVIFIFRDLSDIRLFRIAENRFRTAGRTTERLLPRETA